jgi:hypothetical protein
MPDIMTQLQALRDTLVERGVDADQMQILLPKDEAMKLTVELQKDMKELFGDEFVRTYPSEYGVIAKIRGIRVAISK